uniref:Nitrogen permease regulator 2 n=1 Tax=Globisporangium ultimum (strain ATCC 200006 / CBS 805.95 / DAOM BR144) TaxID=431595 RepID=K3WCL8_GLOUD
MIKGVFYAEFDNVAGPQIVFQAPYNVLSNEVFDSVSGYIIIDKALCGKIITGSVMQMKIVGYPVCIEDDKYHRNALLFNIGFVFDEHVDTAAYRPILRKLGALMESMEKESGFLHVGESKALLEHILPQILHDLTLNGECTIPVNTANVINLKLFPKLQDPSQVFDYQVPVAIRDLRLLLENSAEWDLALQQIVPFIDGVKYVKRISLEADVEIAIVKKCVRQLLYYGCVTMIDIFLHSNIYAITPRISMIANDVKLQAECAVYITKSGKAPPSFSKIFALYCSMQPSLRMSDFCVVYAESLANIDVRRFITFGLIHSFLRRVHRYPIYIDRGSSGSSNQQQQRQYALASSPSPSALSPGTVPSSQSAMGGNAAGVLKRSKAASAKAMQVEKDVLRMMDGEHQTDEICSALMIRFTDVESLVQKHPNCFVVHK